jgi:hypothetical protein
MGAPRPMTCILNELEEIIRNKGITIGITPRISKEILMKYIASPSIEINLINSSLITIKRGMGHMPRELLSYGFDFEKLLFRCILGIFSQHEVWATCKQEKTHG